MSESDENLVPPPKVLRKRLNGVYRADSGFSGPTRRYVLIVALLVGLASVPTLAAITAGSHQLADGKTDTMDIPFIPPASPGPVRVSPGPSPSDGEPPSSAIGGEDGAEAVIRTGRLLGSMGERRSKTAEPSPYAGQEPARTTQPRNVAPDGDRAGGSARSGERGSWSGDGPRKDDRREPGKDGTGDDDGPGKGASSGAGGPSKGAPGGGDGPSKGAPGNAGGPSKGSKPRPPVLDGWGLPTIPGLPAVPGDRDGPDWPWTPDDSGEPGRPSVPGLPAVPDETDPPTKPTKPTKPARPDNHGEPKPGRPGAGKPGPGRPGAGKPGKPSFPSVPGLPDVPDDSDDPPAWITRPACHDRGKCGARPSHHQRPDRSPHRRCETVKKRSPRPTARHRSSDRSDFRRRSAVADRPHNIRPASILERSYNSRRVIPEARSEDNRASSHAYRGSHRADNGDHADDRSAAENRSSRVGRHHAEPTEEHTRW